MTELKHMTIHEMVDLAIQNPELFEKEARAYQLANIKEICKGDGQCEWRLSGFLFKLEQEAKQYHNPTARLNFVVSRFFKYLNENY